MRRQSSGMFLTISCLMMHTQDPMEGFVVRIESLIFLAFGVFSLLLALLRLCCTSKIELNYSIVGECFLIVQMKEWMSLVFDIIKKHIIIPNHVKSWSAHVNWAGSTKEYQGLAQNWGLLQDLKIILHISTDNC